jgi:putative hydrolase of the HAD superfamily
VNRSTIIFDLGGVLVRICRTWEEACILARVEVRDMVRFREPALVARRKHFTHLHQTGAMTCRAYFDAIAGASAGLYSADDVRLVHAAWIIEDFRGVAELVERLARVGYRTACLSNTNHAHWAVLRSGDRERPPSAVVSRLAHRLASHELGRAKPDDEVYRLAEESLNAGPGEIVFFDDTEENVRAARHRGWAAHLIDHAGDPAAQIGAVLGVVGA